MCILFIYRDSNPVLILKPAELAGMSLENRLTSYDWQSQFDVFQRVTRNGSFRTICLDAKNNMLPVRKTWYLINANCSCNETKSILFYIIFFHFLNSHAHLYTFIYNLRLDLVENNSAYILWNVFFSFLDQNENNVREISKNKSANK